MPISALNRKRRTDAQFVSQAQSATVTARAAIIAAVIAGFTGGITSLLGTAWQQSAEDQRNTREAQKTSYAEFISAEQSLKESESTYYYSVLVRFAGDPADSARKYADSKARFRAALTSVRLTGADNAVEKATDSAEAHGNWDSASLDALATLVKVNPNAEQRSAAEQAQFTNAIEPFIPLEDSIKRMSAAFINQARQDLGVDRAS